MFKDFADKLTKLKHKFQEHRQNKKAARANEKHKETWESLLILIVIALFIKSVFLTIFIIPSGSMIPTLKVWDTLIVNKLHFGIFNPLHEIYYSPRLFFFFDNPWQGSRSPLIRNTFIKDFNKEPRRFEVIIFKAPIKPRPAPTYKFIDQDGRERVHRFYMPGKPGVDYVKRCVGLPGDVVELRNGELLINDQYIEQPFSWVNDHSYWGPVRVPEGHYFVLGDNRPYSSDSRFWGFVPKRNLIGRATYVALPPWHWHRLK